MNNFFKILLLLAVLLETIAHVIGVKQWDIKTASCLYFFSGILIALIPLLKRQDNQLKKLPNSKNEKLIKQIYALVFLVFILDVSLYAFDWASGIFEKHAFDASSDMLVIIKMMCDRFLNGTYVYEVLPIWGGIEAIYLPTMWLPFLPTVYFGIDVRWTSMLFLMVGLFFVFFIGKRKEEDLIGFVLFLPIYFLLEGLFFTDFRLISLSEEPIVVTYYLFLAYALSKKNPYIIGIAISLCLMSRFALVFWSMMYLVYVYFFQSKRGAIKIVVTILGITIPLLFWTEAIWQLDVILGLPKIYLEHILANERIFNGFAKTNLGMVKFFPFGAVSLIHKAFFFISIGIPAFSLFCFWKYKKYINQSFFAICSLKLSLVFFYNFLLMPFLYLFYTSTFFSIAILSWYLKEENLKTI